MTPATAANPPRRRRFLAGFAALAAIALLLAGMSWYRGWQLRDSCTGNGGDWDAARGACTFRTPPPAAGP